MVLKKHQFLVSVLFERCSSIAKWTFPGKYNSFCGFNWITDAHHLAVVVVAITARTYSVKNGARKRPTQSKWEIYLFIVTVRVKSTYPVMFVMIFDSILLVGILKRRTALKHSCLMNKRSMLAAVAKWWNLVHSVNLSFFFMFAVFSLSRYIQSSEIAMGAFACSLLSLLVSQ